MNDVARDELALDALAAGRAPEAGDEVLGLLHALRADLDGPAATAPPVTTPVATAPNVVPLRTRRPRRAALVALSAAAGLVVGGLTARAVVTADQPGQLLYAARKAVLGDPKAAERVSRLLDDAAEALAEGDRREARRRLDQAAERLADVEDSGERAVLAGRLARLRALLAAPTPAAPPSPSASPDDDPTPEPTETESPDDDNSGKGSSSSGSGSDGSGSDDSDRSDSSGKGSDDVLKTLDPDDSSGRGGGDDD